MNQSDILLWLQETWTRLRNKSPKYFRVTGIINVVIAAIGAVPNIIEFLDITVPPKWMLVVGKIVFVAGLWAKFNTSLSVAKPSVQPLPFTEKKQIEQDLKDNK